MVILSGEVIELTEKIKGDLMKSMQVDTTVLGCSDEM
jgi:hypothetical protein